MLIFSTRLVPAVAAAAVLAGLAASPASAARARHHHATQIQQEQNFVATVPPGPETVDGNCYPTRMQVPTVGGGLQWENEETCPYPDN
ncbi:MAG: hypothetical protein BGP04_18785 [Rhizobiales bacterium 62-17]|nr:hypothetical protein [Hyphomicrobiales bacterium]OJX99721.1 MAG: hypothetical protein BGP04_18785 [Rhizobiales bacterium 62-17]